MKDDIPSGTEIRAIREFMTFVCQPEILSVLNLHQREIEILSLRWIEAKTLLEIGNTLGITDERVRRIIVNSLYKITNRVNTLKKSYRTTSELVEEIDRLNHNIHHLKDQISIYFNRGPKIFEELIKYKIGDSELSIRSKNCLKKSKIVTIGDLLKLTKDDLQNITGLGENSINEILGYLKDYGLTLIIND